MNIFITGVTGTLGTIVSKKLIDRGHKVFGYSRDEIKQREHPFKDEITMIVGDVRDRRRLIEQTRNMDVIFHFASLKCIDTLEDNPEEAIKTVIDGTDNVLSAQRFNNIERVVFTSTDKAAYPINVYGNCKAVAEALTLRNKRNAVCRYGNVLGSRGSVLPIFVKQLLIDQRVTITHPEMTRFFIRQNDAADFVINCMDSPGRNIPVMKACKVTELARAVADCLEIQDFTAEYTGMRRGEKLHECLMTEVEDSLLYSNTAVQFTRPELVELIRPMVEKVRSAYDSRGW